MPKAKSQKLEALQPCGSEATLSVVRTRRRIPAQMKRLLCLGLGLIAGLSCAKPGIIRVDRLPDQPLLRTELKLASYAFLDAPGVSRFDLSGLQRTPNGDFFVVNDKASIVYRVSGAIKGVVQAEPAVDLKPFIGETVKEFDLESIRRSSRGGVLDCQ